MHRLFRTLLAPLLACVLFASCASYSSRVDSGLWHYNAGLPAQAIPLLVEGVPALDAASPADPRVPQGYVALANLALQDKKPDLAEKFFEKALVNAQTHQAGSPNTKRSTFNVVGMRLLGLGRPSEALPLLVEAARISEETPSIPRRLFAIDLDNMGIAQAALGNDAAADASAARAGMVLDRLEQTPLVKGTRGVVCYNVAYRLATRGKDAEAETAFRESLALISAGPEKWRLKSVAREYEKLLTKLGRSAEAEEVTRPYR